MVQDTKYWQRFHGRIAWGAVPLEGNEPLEGSPGGVKNYRNKNERCFERTMKRRKRKALGEKCQNGIIWQ
jgi:hypothetical protein